MLRITRDAYAGDLAYMNHYDERSRPLDARPRRRMASGVTRLSANGISAPRG